MTPAQYWEKFKDLNDRFPQAHINTNMAMYPQYNFKDMCYNEHELFKHFTNIFSGVFTPESAKLWENYEQSYYALKKQGAFDYSYDNDVQKILTIIKEKASGPVLIPVEKLQEVLIAITQKKKTTYELDYHMFRDLINEYYSMDIDSIIDKSQLTSFVDNSVPEKNSPAQDIHAAKNSIAMRLLYEKAPYFNFWHYLLDNDFSDISNGSSASMFENEDDPQTTEEDVYNDIKNIFFKEAAQLPQIKNTSELTFYISW